jgi:hypothetical protein
MREIAEICEEITEFTGRAAGAVCTDPATKTHVVVGSDVRFSEAVKKLKAKEDVLLKSSRALAERRAGYLNAAAPSSCPELPSTTAAGTTVLTTKNKQQFYGWLIEFEVFQNPKSRPIAFRADCKAPTYWPTVSLICLPSFSELLSFFFFHDTHLAFSCGFPFSGCRSLRPVSTSEIARSSCHEEVCSLARGAQVSYRVRGVCEVRGQGALARTGCRLARFHVQVLP